MWWLGWWCGVRCCLGYASRRRSAYSARCSLRASSPQCGGAGCRADRSLDPRRLDPQLLANPSASPLLSETAPDVVVDVRHLSEDCVIAHPKADRLVADVGGKS